MGDLRTWTETVELNLRSIKAELEHSKVLCGRRRFERGAGHMLSRAYLCVSNDVRQGMLPFIAISARNVGVYECAVSCARVFV